MPPHYSHVLPTPSFVAETDAQQPQHPLPPGIVHLHQLFDEREHIALKDSLMPENSVFRHLRFIQNFILIYFERVPPLQGKSFGQFRHDHTEHGVTLNVLYL